ncbi:lectin C-type domain protein [Elysia marginata]|uniref:Lectin C-type domain protein n=1 Tax=Elysia marginata TaxID=1093978 RepID=A0AAV4FJ48_9GAST|nr:lectin C-type domain protein [Elysia marginata]
MSNKANLVFLCIVIAASLRPTHCQPDVHVHLSVIPDPLCCESYQAHTISCNTDTYLIPIQHVTSLTVYASQGYAKNDEYTRLAAVECGKASPLLFDSSKQYDVSGNIGTGNDNMSQLVFSWKSPWVQRVKSYKCEVQGVDTKGRNVTISVIAEAPTSECFPDKIKKTQTVCAPVECGPDLMDQDQLEASTETILHGVTNLTAELGRSTKKVHFDFDALQIMVIMLDDKVGAQTSEIKDIQWKISSFIALYKYTYLVSNFDILGTFRGKRYYVSKTEALFDIWAADGQCSRLDGHLVEIDDQAEYNFVVKKLKIVSGDTFLTGGNDINKENDWRFWHSNRPMTFSRWHEGQPDNYEKYEDCLEIAKEMEGKNKYNDIGCDVKGKFICEDQM